MTSTNLQPMTAEMVAVRLDRSVTTIWRLMHEGRLTGKRMLGRTVFDARQVDQLAAVLGR